MKTPILAEALQAAFDAPLTLPASFHQLVESVTPNSEKLYTSHAPCPYYHAAQYRTNAFYKHASRVINYEQPFPFEEIS